MQSYASSQRYLGKHSHTTTLKTKVWCHVKLFNTYNGASLLSVPPHRTISYNKSFNVTVCWLCNNLDVDISRIDDCVRFGKKIQKPPNAGSWVISFRILQNIQIIHLFLVLLVFKIFQLFFFSFFFYLKVHHMTHCLLIIYIWSEVIVVFYIFC